MLPVYALALVVLLDKAITDPIGTLRFIDTIREREPHLAPPVAERLDILEGWACEVWNAE